MWNDNQHNHSLQSCIAAGRKANLATISCAERITGKWWGARRSPPIRMRGLRAEFGKHARERD